MPVRRIARLIRQLPLLALALASAAPTFAQSTKPAASYPARLPYAFTNFVWWTDADLRAELKKRLPGLGDEIAPNHAAESKVRDVLHTLLLQKGIDADIMSEDPSPSSLTAERDPGVPGPAITFEIVNPQVLVDKVIISGAPAAATDTLNQSLKVRGDREYSGWQNWVTRTNAETELQHAGYFDAKADVDHDAPRREDDHYLVNLLVSITPGAQYHIGEITGDGGPLLQGRDLSTVFKVKPGDLATRSPFGQLAGQLLAFYEHNGYADVVVDAPPILDHEHALVSYHLTVKPGPQYILHSLTILNLTAAQESRVRELLGVEPGDVFDELALMRLSDKMRADPALNSYSFGFTPKKDAAAATVDLTLDFSRNSDQPTVTVH